VTRIGRQVCEWTVLEAGRGREKFLCRIPPKAGLPIERTTACDTEGPRDPEGMER
jgi:hypothetical protein